MRNKIVFWRVKYKESMVLPVSHKYESILDAFAGRKEGERVAMYAEQEDGTHLWLADFNTDGEVTDIAI